MAADLTRADDEGRLAELGYKQELDRSWSGFSNFAISFSIISILAGCFTTFYFGWNNGGPIAISIGWVVISAFIMLIGFLMAELVSAYPTSGGIYWWASKLGGAKAGYYTGWLNLIGLLAIVASVAYGAATFLDFALMRFSESWAAGYSLDRVFWMFVGVLALATLVNIFSNHLLAVLNNISVWWHVFGAAAVILILIFLPENHSSVSEVFTGRVNNTLGLNGGATEGPGFWFYVLPLGLLLTQYTITGYDASAHLSEETQGAANAASPGHLAVDLLLGDRRLDPAAVVPVRRPGQGCGDGRWGWRADHLRPGAQPEDGGNGPADRRYRPTVLHHGMPHLVLAHAVRVQP